MGWVIALFAWSTGSFFVLAVVHGAAKLSRERSPQ